MTEISENEMNSQIPLNVILMSGILKIFLESFQKRHSKFKNKSKILRRQLIIIVIFKILNAVINVKKNPQLYTVNKMEKFLQEF